MRIIIKNIKNDYNKLKGKISNALCQWEFGWKMGLIVKKEILMVLKTGLIFF